MKVLILLVFAKSKRSNDKSNKEIALLKTYDVINIGDI